ncbi:MAG: hypothetical protein Q8R12_04410 [bacterium]|nr:hypothetical protein [bacterium]
MNKNRFGIPMADRVDEEDSDIELPEEKIPSEAEWEEEEEEEEEV